MNFKIFLLALAADSPTSSEADNVPSPPSEPQQDIIVISDDDDVDNANDVGEKDDAKKTSPSQSSGVEIVETLDGVHPHDPENKS